MFPIILDTKLLNIVLIGDGSATARRKKLLEDAGCEFTHLPLPPGESWGEGVTAAPSPGAARHPLPWGEGSIVFIADFDEVTTARIYKLAKEAGALVNAEDKKEYCDFHVPAIVRRGDLLLTVSTGAKSPRLARRIRQWLQAQFGEEWAERLESLGKRREEWRREGAGFQELADKSDEIIDGGEWLKRA